MADLGPMERAILEDAASWRLIGLTLERPRPRWAETIRAIAKERAVDEEVAELSRRVLEAASEAAFLAAFGPGGEVSPREVSYRRMGDPGRILAELAVMYETFSFMPDTEEALDHVSVEVAFVAFLGVKEAYARMMGDDEPAQIIREARELFVSEHLSYLICGLDDRLRSGYLRQVVHVLSKRVGPIPELVRSSALGASAAPDFDCVSGCSFGEE